MSDDIVTRLRAEGEMEPVGDGTKVWWLSEICQEAANEIERLQTELDRWRNIAEGLYVIAERNPPIADGIQLGSDRYVEILHSFIYAYRGLPNE